MSRFILNLVPHIPLVNDYTCLSNISVVGPSSGQSNSALNFGGGSGNSGRRLYGFSIVGDYLVSDPSAVNQESVFRYVAHVDDMGLLAYSSAQFVHANIPLSELFKFLPVSHARKIASVHCISAGSRCNKAELLMHVENHSCSRCSSHLTVFSVETPVSRKKKPEPSVKKPKPTSINRDENTVPEISEFPPDPADTDLTRAILSKACKKMLPNGTGR